MSAAMGRGALLTILVLTFCGGPAPCTAASLEAHETPVTKVVSLLKDLKNKIEGDGLGEQQSYDKFACWAEETLQRKVRDIQSGKDSIAKLQSLIKKLMGELGAHGVEIKHLNKLIAANSQSQREAAELRENEAAEYNSEKVESEQCLGALEAAITVLNGAGTKLGACPATASSLERLRD